MAVFYKRFAKRAVKFAKKEKVRHNKIVPEAIVRYTNKKALVEECK